MAKKKIAGYKLAIEQLDDRYEALEGDWVVRGKYRRIEFGPVATRKECEDYVRNAKRS